MLCGRRIQCVTPTIERPVWSSFSNSGTVTTESCKNITRNLQNCMCTCRFQMDRKFCRILHHWGGTQLNIIRPSHNPNVFKYTQLYHLDMTQIVRANACSLMIQVRTSPHILYNHEYEQDSRKYLYSHFIHTDIYKIM